MLLGYGKRLKYGDRQRTNKAFDKTINVSSDQGHLVSLPAPKFYEALHTKGLQRFWQYDFFGGEQQIALLEADV